VDAFCELAAAAAEKIYDGGLGLVTIYLLLRHINHHLLPRWSDE
jgi:hypothetical protein